MEAERQNLNRHLEFLNDFYVSLVKISSHVSLPKGRNKFAYFRNYDMELRSDSTLKYRGELVNLTRMEGRGGHRAKLIGVKRNLKRVFKSHFRKAGVYKPDETKDEFQLREKSHTPVASPAPFVLTLLVLSLPRWC